MLDPEEEPEGSFFVDDPRAEAGTWIAHCDGGAWPNPGAMAVGAVLTSPAGVVHSLSRRLSGIGCNNEAEWRATVAVLELALQHGARNLLLHTDSTQVRDQLCHPGSPPLPTRLQALVEEARKVAARLPKLDVRWLPRHRNAGADALARQALGLPPKPVQTPHPSMRGRR